MHYGPGARSDPVNCLGSNARLDTAMNLDPPPFAASRDAVRALRASSIREVANAGMGRDDVLKFWFGEPDEVTPEFIRRAGIEALERGETFYVQNLGLPELRDALAAYVSGLHRPLGADNIAVTSSGKWQAVQPVDLNSLDPSSISLRSFCAEGSSRGGADKARMKAANNST